MFMTLAHAFRVGQSHEHGRTLTQVNSVPGVALSFFDSESDQERLTTERLVMKLWMNLWMLLMIGMGGAGAVDLAREGRTQHVIWLATDATLPEQNAAKELARTLKEITDADFALQEATKAVAPERAILVGPSPAARAEFGEVPFDELGSEEFVIKTRGNRLLLTGGRPRGTLYAVNHFLQEQCGVRWWTPWAGHIPKKPTLDPGDLELRAKPAFEYREPFWYPAFNPEWAVRNLVNGQSARIPAELGGCVKYKGFVHTFYSLVPPQKYFAEHPEWFSLLQGKRTFERAQLCLTNPKLRDFTVERVKEWLRESPDCGIVSVSQNDWHGACECAECRAVDEAEGSHAGTVLAFVNHIAEQIEPEFPQIAVDTLAYQYTRKPPRTIQPRSNVIVRLCSIECNFREPLDHPSNVSFAEDIRGWSKICQRLYVWDYTTDFAHYVQPHPNWQTLGANVRFFSEHHVRGLFEQGAYQSHGSEMAELRAWVLARLLWDPKRDDRALIGEFLDGYYGPAARPIGQYLEGMREASRGHNLTCYSGTDAPFLAFRSLAEAERLWQEAERSVEGRPDLLIRVKLGHLPVRYVWLSRWEALRKECREAGAVWPIAASRKQVAEEWRAVAEGVPEKPWTRVTLLSEGGLTVDKFLGRFSEDPTDP